MAGNMGQPDFKRLNTPHQQPANLADEGETKDPLGEVPLEVKIKQEEVGFEGDQEYQPSSFKVLQNAVKGAEMLNLLWHDSTYKDVVITTTDCKSAISCHSSILRLASSYLAQLLTNSNETEDSIRIHIEDVPSEVVQTFVKRMYCVNTGRECDALTMINLLRSLKVSSKENATPQVSKRKTGRPHRKVRKSKSDCVDTSDLFEDDVKDGDICRANMEPVHDKAMLEIKGKAFLREEYKAHRLPGFDDDTFNQKEKKELLEAVWYHYKTVHSLPRGLDMWCKRCYTKLTRVEKGALCSNKKMLDQQWCSDCTKHPNDIPRFNPDPEEGILANGGVVDVCSICCQKYNAHDHHVCRPYIEGEEAPLRKRKREERACSDVKQELAEETKPAATPKKKSKKPKKTTASSKGPQPVCTVCQEPYSSKECPTCQPEKQSQEDNPYYQRFVKEEALCIECGKKFKNKMYLGFHMNEHKGLTPYVCEFEGCDYKSHAATSLNMHMSLTGHHTNTPHARKKCQKCKEYISKTESQEIHDEKHHKPDLPFSCDSCEYKADTEADISKHRERIHHVQCAYCCITTPQIKMRAHLKLHHSKNLPHECPECAYRAATLNAVKRHSSLWHNGSWERNKWFPGKSRIACSNGCGKTYTKGYAMNHHAKYTCPLSKVEAEKIKEFKDKKKAKVKEYTTKWKDNIVKYTGYVFSGELRDCEEDK